MATFLVQPLATVRVQLQPSNLNKNLSKKVSSLSFQPYHNELVVRHPISTQKNRVHSRVISIRAETKTSPAQLWQEITDREFQLDDFKKLRQDFLNVLRSRRSEVPLTVEQAKPVANPLYQLEHDPPLPEEIARGITNYVDNLDDLLVQENLYLRTEDGEQGRVPVLIISKKQNVKTKRPAIVFLHPTTTNKEYVTPYLKAFASRDYVAISIDSRYHGERAKSKTSYQEGLMSAWKNGDTMPFIYDTVWDLIKLNDYLITRDDIDSDRIGMSGISLGGMHTWFAGFADPRYAVLAPMIGVQGFRWAIDNDKWQGRVFSELKPMFEEGAKDMGKTEIDIEVVEKVWDRIAPGLASMFDSPYTIPGKATRPLLIVNAQNDPRNPIGGLEVPKTRATKLYESQQVGPNFKLHVEPDLEHDVNENMIKVVSDWFDKHLLNLEA